MALEAQRRAREFDVARMADAYLALYREKAVS
jgi:hypothetical protein